MDLPKWSNGVSQHLLKVEDGKSVVGTFRGTVHRYYEHWVHGRSSLCTRNQGNCQNCASDDENIRKAKGKFRVNFIVKDPQTGEPIAKILEGGKKLYEQMVNINKDVPIDTVWVRLSRTGTRQNTQWLLAPLAGDKGIITAEAQKKIREVELHDVTGGAAAAVEEEESGAANGKELVAAEEEIPF